MSGDSILLIDDEPNLLSVLTVALRSRDYVVYEAQTARDGIQLARTGIPDLILLDLGLPDANGLDVLTLLREWYVNPIIVISVQNSQEVISKALENGATDYLLKPFRTNELLTRIQAAIAHSKYGRNLPALAFDDLTIDFQLRTVSRKGDPIELTTNEYKLLSLLTRNEGKVLTQRYLSQEIFGGASDKGTQQLIVLISQLRKKIEKDPNRPAYLLNESGLGYRFVGKI